MGRRSKIRELSVWMNGERVGTWRRPPGGGQEFEYAEAWLTSPYARPISLSLPLRPAGTPYRAGVETFFENLLPDNRDIRERIQRRFHTESVGAFDLLAEIGRDCVGALQLLAADESPAGVRQITGRRLNAGGVAALLAGLLNPASAYEPGLDEAFRISLAGAQEKTALLWHQGAWHCPTQATPTTHILKLPLGISPQSIDLTTSVENEWLCAQIVRAYGIEVAACAMETFGPYRTLVVERFDRRLAADGAWYLRLPQEDLCQATGTPAARKYESDGGPGIPDMLRLLLGSEEPGKEGADFLLTQFVFWLLAAIDGHAKNFSFFLLPGGSFRLAPRYDVLSAYPIMGHGRGKLAPEKIRMAMAVQGKNRHYRWQEIQVRHWLETARRFGLPSMPKLVAEAIDRTPEVIRQAHRVLPKGFPAAIADTIGNGLAARAKQAANELAHWRG